MTGGLRVMPQTLNLHLISLSTLNILWFQISKGPWIMTKDLPKAKFQCLATAGSWRWSYDHKHKIPGCAVVGAWQTQPETGINLVHSLILGAYVLKTSWLVNDSNKQATEGKIWSLHRKPANKRQVKGKLALAIVYYGLDKWLFVLHLYSSLANNA